MVRVTCLYPMKSYSYCSSALAHLENLIFKLRTAILLLEAINEQHTKQTTSIAKNNTPKQKKGLKEHTKDRARFYDYESARNTENGAGIEKKQLSKDLFYY